MLEHLLDGDVIGIDRDGQVAGGPGAISLAQIVVETGQVREARDPADMARPVVRGMLDRGEIMRLRRREATRGDEVVGIFHLGHGTPGIAADHQGPECVGALPDRNLPERRGGKDRDGGDDPASLPRVGHALAVCDIGDEPDRGENEANVGHIGEPVGMPLKSRLGHDAEHRQQGHAEPGKPHRQRRLPPGRNGDHDTPCDRNETAAGDRGGREFARRMPVERLEPRRPDGRRDISDECMEGIGQPRGH